MGSFKVGSYAYKAKKDLTRKKNSYPGISSTTLQIIYDIVRNDVEVAMASIETDRSNMFSGFSKITVGSEAPVNPQLNDLWIDTNI